MEYTAEQRAIRDAVSEYSREEIRPGARVADERAEFPESVWDDLAELDLTAMSVPEEYGGLDVDRVTYALVMEEIAYGSLAVGTALGVHCLATACLATFGDERQRARWLPAMVDGRPVGAFALSEPTAGSNPRGMTTEARREGDEYVITGEKQWITNGERSGVVILFAKADRDDPDSITQFVVPKDVDGLTVGPPEDKLGLRASDTTPLTFDEVRIPVANRLTPEGEGLSAALSILTGGRIGVAALAVGVGQAALDAAVDYAEEREQFGRPIGEFQTIRHLLADVATGIEAARRLTRDAARRDDAGEAVRARASMAKLFASETAVRAAERAVQVHGGAGYTTAHDVERLYRDAMVTRIYEGTSEIQRDIIGDHLF